MYNLNPIAFNATANILYSLIKRSNVILCCYVVAVALFDDVTP